MRRTWRSPKATRHSPPQLQAPRFTYGVVDRTRCFHSAHAAGWRRCPRGGVITVLEATPAYSRLRLAVRPSSHRVLTRAEACRSASRRHHLHEEGRLAPNHRLRRLASVSLGPSRSSAGAYWL